MIREAIPAPPGDSDSGVTMAEAGRRLGVAVETVRRLIELDHLLAWRIMGKPRGSRIRVSARSIEDYRAQFKVRPRGQPVPVHGLSSSRSRVRHSAAHDEAVRYINSLGTRRP